MDATEYLNTIGLLDIHSYYIAKNMTLFIACHAPYSTKQKFLKEVYLQRILDFRQGLK